MNFTYIAALLSLSLSATVQAEESALTVKINGISDPVGLVMIALENDAAAYDNGPLEKASFKGEVKKAEGSALSVTFTGITAGTYAVKAFHDANGNMILDKNFMGIPTENYGFSNDARGTFGPAKFEDARFQYIGGSQIIIINLK